MDMEKVKAAGINCDEGIKRFAGNFALYSKFLVKFFSDNTFLELKDSIANCEYDEAFKKAHTLKGLAGNLSMNEFFKPLSVVVEDLRNNQVDNLQPLIDELDVIYISMRDAVIG